MSFIFVNRSQLLLAKAREAPACGGVSDVLREAEKQADIPTGLNHEQRERQNDDRDRCRFQQPGRKQTAVPCPLVCEKKFAGREQAKDAKSSKERGSRRNARKRMQIDYCNVQEERTSDGSNSTDQDLDGAWERLVILVAGWAHPARTVSEMAGSTIEGALRRRTQRAREHDRVALRILQPALVVGVFGAMARLETLRVQLYGARHGRLEVVELELEPEQHAIPVRFEIGISERPVLVHHIPAVQLKNQPAVPNEPFVLAPAVIALAAKEALIPAAARFDIVHANQRLQLHGKSSACCKLPSREWTPNWPATWQSVRLDEERQGRKPRAFGAIVGRGQTQAEGLCPEAAARKLGGSPSSPSIS